MDPQSDGRTIEAAPRSKLASDSDGYVYIKVADELREEILQGNPSPGERLPSEVYLSKRFGVSRSSIREALRVLASQGLIMTHRGATGGSTVLQPDHHVVMDMLKLNMRSMIAADGCSEEELEEVRELLEVSAAWLAAARRTPADVGRIKGCIPETATAMTVEQNIEMNLQFHFAIFRATGNRLLHLFAEPVHDLIYTFFKDRPHSSEDWEVIHAEHRKVARAIEARDQDAARRAMSSHIRTVRADDDDIRMRSPFTGLSFDIDG